MSFSSSSPQKYQVMARKYRPQTFRDVVGQEGVVTTLKNALRFEKIAHAYLFCGSRGVGKTTLARLFAKALNCQSLSAEGEPCNQCPSCTEITAGQSLDVIEIDGASNRGIDDIRQINETVGYAPSHGKYKIYLIDEVHMLTKEAFNALLKTLEEPPARAKFFFATTEPHKVLPTIISRCQRFDLGRIPPQFIATKLDQIAKDLNRSVEPEVFPLIASFADGSLRDAESLFDQILCFAEGTVAAQQVRQVLGLVSDELFFGLDQAFAEYRLSYAFELTETLFQTGKDLGHFLEQLIEHYRQLTLAKTLGEKALPSEIAARYSPSLRLYTQSQCLHILDLLIQAEGTFQKSAFQRISLETILLQIIRSKHRIPVEVLIRRLDELEQTLTERAKNLEEFSPQATTEPVRKEEVIPPAEAIQPLQHEKAIFEPQPQPVPIPIPIPSNPPPRQEAPVLSEQTLQEVPFRPFVQEAASSAKIEQPIAEKAEVLEPQSIAPRQETPVVSEQKLQKAPVALKEEKQAPEIRETPLAKAALDQPATAEDFLNPAPKEPLPTSLPAAAPAVKAPPVIAAKEEPKTPAKHPSHYDTIMRFATVELEGTLNLSR